MNPAGRGAPTNSRPAHSAARSRAGEKSVVCDALVLVNSPRDEIPLRLSPNSTCKCDGFLFRKSRRPARTRGLTAVAHRVAKPTGIRFISRLRAERRGYRLNLTFEKEKTLNLRKTFLIAVTICVVAIGSVLYGGFGFAATSNSAGCDLIASACGRCGDGQCVKSCGETAQSCPKDCGGVGVPSSATVACGKCGDGRCVPQCGENATSCPRDCGVTSKAAETSAALQPGAVN